MPEGDYAEDHEVGKQERGHGRGSIDEVVEGMNGRAAKVAGGVEDESPEAYAGFQQQDGRAKVYVLGRNSHDERDSHESHGDRTGIDGNPFQGIKESVASVVGETEDEVSDEASEA